MANWIKAINAASSFARGWTQGLQMKQEKKEREEEQEERKRRWEAEYEFRKQQADRDAVRLDWERDERIRQQKLDALNLSRLSMQNAMLEKNLSYADADRQYLESTRRLARQKENLLIEDAHNRSMASRMALEERKKISESGYDAYTYIFGRLSGTDTKVSGQVVANSLAAAADAAQRFGLPLEWTQAQAEAISAAISESKPKAWKLGSYIDKDGTEITYVLDESGHKIEGSEIDSNKLHPEVEKVYKSVVDEYNAGLTDFISNYSKTKGIYSAAAGSVLNINNLGQVGTRKVFGEITDLYTAQVEQYEKRYGTFRELYDRKMVHVLPDKEVRDKFFDLMAPSFAHTKSMADVHTDVGKWVREAVEVMQVKPTKKDGKEGPPLSDEGIRAVMTREIEQMPMGRERVIAQGALNRLIPHQPPEVEDRGPSFSERLMNPRKRWDTGPFEAIKDWWKQHEKKKEMWESPLDRMREWKKWWKE